MTQKEKKAQKKEHDKRWKEGKDKFRETIRVGYLEPYFQIFKENVNGSNDYKNYSFDQYIKDLNRKGRYGYNRGSFESGLTDSILMDNGIITDDNTYTKLTWGNMVFNVVNTSANMAYLYTRANSRL